MACLLIGLQEKQEEKKRKKKKEEKVKLFVYENLGEKIYKLTAV